MYCSHYFPLECVEKLILIAMGVSAGAALFDFVFAPIITMALLIAAGYIVKRLMPSVWAVLNGYMPPYRKTDLSTSHKEEQYAFKLFNCIQGTA